MIAEALGLPDPDSPLAEETRERVLAVLRDEIEKIALSASLTLSDVLSLTMTEREILADVSRKIADERAINLGLAIRGEVSRVMAPYDGGAAMLDDHLDAVLDAIDARTSARGMAA